MADLFDIVVARKLSGGGGGSSDFSTATVAVAVSDGNFCEIVGAYFGVFDVSEQEQETTEGVYSFNVGTETVNVVLYKGKATLLVDTEGSLSVNGDAFILPDGSVLVTGDCTLTISTSTST